MRRDLLMPKLGLTMTEGLVAEWMVAEGATFRTGDVLYLVETEKVVNEVLAEEDGVLLHTLVPAGDTVPVGTPIARWDDAPGAVDVSGAAAAGAPAPAPSGPAAAPAPAVQAPVPPTAAIRGERIVSTPLARRLARLHGIDLARVTGSGPRGRIKADDVLAAHARQPGIAAVGDGPVSGAAASGAAAPVAAAPTGASATSARPAAASYRTVAPTAVQLATARRLTAVKQTVPHFYLSVDVDVRRLLALRAELNDGGSPRLTLTHFIVAALGRALADLPDANRVWLDDAILSFDAADVGIAVDTARGLFVPVLRDAARLSLPALAREAGDLVERARAGRLTAADTSGAAVTVSNAGMHQVAYMTPIITPGQAMILGVGSVREVFRPDAHGQPELRRELGLVLACDHRLLDGVSGLRFLNRVVHHLERPLHLVLGA
jgi:pyruvate dehydrogenase E2 component (dihydrolipoamide acetyltransferase)